ncbi:hypothetical protein [uncultured Marinobacter sp.]|uniref:hypothetical protein n=1 Tax=uncultured Marinobacter sp. TaxID=187379 RepID=UPI00260D5209|nr:hypothetical protein [uncultured Marinobacter sp.]
MGIDALREYQIRADLCAEVGEAPFIVDQRTPAGFSSLPAPSIGSVLRQWRRVMSEALAILKEPDVAFEKLDLLSSLAIRIHDLSYLTALFERLRRERPNLRVVFSTADLPAHAACLAGFKPEYHQHGLLAAALVFPEFSFLVALTSYEGRYVAERVPGLRFRVSAHGKNAMALNSVVAIACDYMARDPAPSVGLIRLAHLYGFKVVVRPHPKGDENLLRGIRDCEGVIIDPAGSFDDFMEKWRPTIVASWYSTTLLDGLLFGALPVTFSKGVPATVLPLDDISLGFPQEASRIESCMRSADQRSNEHNTLIKLVTE